MLNFEKNILAVDDAELILHVLRTFLKDTEYKLTCTTSSKIALNFLQKSKPDLFILDIDMPEMNGYELAMKIRDCGQQAPIIFLTGNTSQESVEKALMVGASDFIAKPISKTRLLERIAKFI
ncbi:MAG: response regulator [Fibromonadaceae bacterium]|jgi:CheY-like chemotaxis protein|nr:response regulator [Fibromonadaceae bacterium]